jgi:hypothetical protein
VLAADAALPSDTSTWINATSSFTGSAFDPATVSQVTLSNSNQTATHNSATNGGARVALTFSTGKFYFEILLVKSTGSFGSMGLLPAASSYIDLGVGGTNIVKVNKGGLIEINGIYQAGADIGSFTDGAGDVLKCAVDFDAHKVWFRKNTGNWNNNGSANPATGVGGLTIPTQAYAPGVAFVGTGTAVNDEFIASFGATGPAGFGAWGVSVIWTPFKLTKTLSSPSAPERPGLIHVRPKIGKASATIYLDPKVELTPASTTTLMASTHKSSRYAYEGTETTETSIVRTGGTPHSRKIVTSANSQWLRPYRAEPYAVWNATTGADVTVTVYGNAATLPLNDEVWMDVEYLGDASSTLGKIVTTTKANVLATGVSVASDASSWAGGTTPFKLVAVLNSPQPGQPGLINIRVKAGKPSMTVYIDPTPELS